MEDDNNVADLLEELGDNIDDLETVLEPLLTAKSLSSLNKNLAPLERAKLLIWLTYAVETILFSQIRLGGAEDPKSHPIMTELKRIQQYMQKVALVENPDVGKRTNLTLNKEAAGRFIKAGLSGNDKYDKELAERKAREKENAHRKLQQLELNFAASNSSPARPSFEQVEVGDGVFIQAKKLPHGGQGVVAKVLSKKPHRDGVKVELDDGRIGRVVSFAGATAGKALGTTNEVTLGESRKKRKADKVEEEVEVEEDGIGDAMEVEQQVEKPTPNSKRKGRKAKKQKEHGIND
ncbi:ATP synthase subunit alpha [Venturia nashicola]|uniref:Exosome complex protein n=1 Tax=Venturia nashicola TaxID=86259 RepID=A0A4Z1P8Q1_9PEZI|nr:ATP synthase subunit alpha [Venturia nashicola]